MCDIPDSSPASAAKTKDPRRSAATIDDEDVEEVIFKKGRIGEAGDTEGTRAGRRFSKRAEKFDKYNPKKEYTKEDAEPAQTTTVYRKPLATDSDDQIEPRVNSLKNHKTTSADADDLPASYSSNAQVSRSS